MGLDIYIRKVSKRNHEKTACEAWDYESTARRRSLKRFMDKVDSENSNERIDALKRQFSKFIWGIGGATSSSVRTYCNSGTSCTGFSRPINLTTGM